MMIYISFIRLTIFINRRQQSSESRQSFTQVRVPQIVTVSSVSSEGAIGIARALVVALRLDDRSRLVVAKKTADVD